SQAVSVDGVCDTAATPTTETEAAAGIRIFVVSSGEGIWDSKEQELKGLRALR
ncbi:hypothetical protein U1Q18_009564, partial [Sarracenia purpurea var. burkii]